MVDKLTPIQIAEIKKAFASCDRDGNGFLDAEELKLAIINITDEIPTDTELKKIMEMVDKNGDGKIELDEFLLAVANWFSEDDYKTVTRKRKMPDSQQRIDIHSKIRGFFQQFHEETQFDRIRKALEGSRMTRNLMRSDDVNDVMDVEGNISSSLSSEAKLQFLEEYRSTMKNLNGVIQALADPFRQGEAVACISKLLSIVEIFKTPIERRSIVEDIIPLFQELLSQAVIPVLCKLLDCSNSQTQFEALRALTFLAPGPRIANTPQESPFHPSYMLCKRSIIAENAVQTFIRHIQHSQVQMIKEQAILAITAIAAHNPEARDYVLQCGILPPVIEQITNNTPIALLRKIVWCLSIMVGVTHPPGSLPPWSQISPALEPLSSMLWVEDDEVISIVCPALSILLPGMPEMTVNRRLVDLAKKNIPRVAVAALSTLNQIIVYDNIQLGILLNNCSLLLHLRELLQSPIEDVQYEVCQMLLVLAGSKGQIGPILQYEIPTIMGSLFLKQDSIRPLLMKLYKYLTRGTPQHTQVLVESNVISLVCQGLVHFRSYDKLLTKMYKYTGATYDFPFAHDALLTLDNIINFGEMETEYTQQLNRYALMFDMECLDKIGSLLEMLKSNVHQEEINAWREHYGGISLEQRVINLLSKIHRVRAAAIETNTNPIISNQIISWIQQLSDKLYKNEVESTHLLSEEIPYDHSAIFKIEFEDDIRVLTLPKTISFSTFYESVEQKFNVEGLRITFLDEENDEITVDSDELLSAAIKRFGDQKSIKLKAHRKKKNPNENNNNTNVNNMSTDSQDDNRRSSTQLKKSKIELSDSSASEKQVLLNSADAPLKPLITSSGPLYERSRSTSLAAPVDKPMDKKTLETKPDLPKDLSFNLEDIKNQNAKYSLDTFANQTHFGQDEIEKIQKKWQSQCSPDGTVSREDFCAGLYLLGVRDPLLIEQYYNAFDRDKDGRINFLEFITGLSVVRKGTLDERLRFMFAAYDSDGNGVLDETEVYNMLKATAISRGRTISHDDLKEMVKKTFHIADENNDGVLSFEEFSNAVKGQRLIVAWFQDLPF